MKRLSWEPVRKGAIYCSPGCGGRCTFEAYEYAQAEAAKLSRSLGKAWKPRVWENIGWYYEARSSDGQFTVTKQQGGVYVAILVGRYVYKAPTAKAAVRGAINAARAEVQSVQEIIARAEDYT